MQAVARKGEEAMTVRLGAVALPLQAQLDGFKSRALRAEAPAQRDLYATEWCELGQLGAGITAVLVLGSNAPRVAK